MFYKNWLPFHVAEDPEFIKLCEMMRPGLGGKLLSRKDLSGKALSNEHDTIEEEMRSSLQVKICNWICFAFDLKWLKYNWSLFSFIRGKTLFYHKMDGPTCTIRPLSHAASTFHERHFSMKLKKLKKLKMQQKMQNFVPNWLRMPSFQQKKNMDAKSLDLFLIVKQKWWRFGKIYKPGVAKNLLSTVALLIMSTLFKPTPHPQPLKVILLRYRSFFGIIKSQLPC